MSIAEQYAIEASSSLMQANQKEQAPVSFF